RGVGQATAEIEQEFAKPNFLGLLGFVVAWPVLLVGWLGGDRIGDELGSLAVIVAGTDESGGEDVLARPLAQLEVVTRAGRHGAEGNAVRAAGGLRRNDPDALGASDVRSCRDFQSLQLAEVHGAIPR